MKFSLDRHRDDEGLEPAQRAGPRHGRRGGRPADRAAASEGAVLAARGQLADRAGMPVSPTQAKKLDDKFGTAPVCVGPWQFTERVAQDRIVVERSPHYFDPGPGEVRPDRLPHHPRRQRPAGQPALGATSTSCTWWRRPTPPASRRRAASRCPASPGIGYDGITINLRNKTGKHAPPGDLGTPLANDPRVREALELSIDREALNQVAWEGQYTPAARRSPPISPFFDKSRKCPARDVARAKKLLADAGLAGGYAFELTIVNNPQERRVGEVIQGMAREAGFNITLRPEGVRLGAQGQRRRQAPGVPDRLERARGSRRQHPPVPGLQGQPEPDPRLRRALDALLNQAREVSDQKERVELYREAIDKIGARRNIIYLYHRNYIVAFPKNLKGYKAVPDGLIRIKGVSWNYRGGAEGSGGDPWRLARRHRVFEFLIQRGFISADHAVPHHRHRVHRRAHDPRRSRAGDGRHRGRRRGPRGDPREVRARDPIPSSTSAGSGWRCAATSASRSAPATRCSPGGPEAADHAPARRFLRCSSRWLIAIPAGRPRGGAPEHRVGLPGQQRVPLRRVDPELLAGDHADPAGLGAARVAARLGLRPVRPRTPGQPPAPADAGGRARAPPGRRPDAPDPQQR